MLFPLFFFTAFAGGLSGVSKTPGFDFPDGYTAFQFVFVLLQASAFGGVFTGFAIARDFESGFGRRMMLAATNRLGILGGYALAGIGRTVFIWVLLTAIALLVGMKVGGSVSELVGLYTLAAIANLMAVMWAAGIALRIRSIQAGPLMQTPVFLILFLTPVYVPLDLLHGWVKSVAGINPITALLEAGREFISGGDPRTLLAFGVGVALIVVFTVWSVTGRRRAEAAGG